MATRSEFAASLKTKYPQYQNVDDSTLVDRMLEKYPQYKAKISDPPAPIPAPAAADPEPLQPIPKMGFKGAVKEVVKSVIPSRVEYGQKPAADQSFLGKAGAYAEDALSLPRRITGAFGEKIKADVKAFPGYAKPADYLPGVKRELQKTEGESFVEDLSREAPLMMIPGGGGRAAARTGAKAMPKLAAAAEEAGLPLKAWVEEAGAEAAAAIPKVVEQGKSLGQKALGGLKRMVPSLGRDMRTSALQTAPQAAYHQLKSVQENGKADVAGGAVEMGAGAALPLPLRALGGMARMVPQGSKWLMAKFSGANQEAMQRASERGGEEALKKVAGENSAESLADELIEALGRKEELLHPEPKLAAEIAPKLPPVQAVEGMNRRNAVAISNGKEIPIDFNERLEPLRTGPGKPSIQEMDALEKDMRARAKLDGVDEGLPVGNEKYAAVARTFQKESRDRSAVSNTLNQTVLGALREAGPILVDDNLRAQLNLTGGNWRSVLKDYGLDMFTTDKKIGKSLDRAAMEIGEHQEAGRLDGIARITDEHDLVNALAESIGKRTRKPDEMQSFLENALRTGENAGDVERVAAGTLGKGDFVRNGGMLFRVVKNQDDQVILDGPAKVVLKSSDPVHIDKGSRMSAGGSEEAPRGSFGEGAEIPIQAPVVFRKTLTRGRERFRDILEEKLKEPALTPEKQKTIAKLEKVLELADQQLQGRETLSAVEAIEFKRAYQDVLAEQYKSRDSDEYFGVYKRLAHSLRVGIEEAAEESKNPEYITIMRNLANKLQVIDRVETRFLGGQLSKAQEKAAGQIRMITNDAKKPALRDLRALDGLFGTNFAERAKDIGFAKMLEMSAEGIPLVPLHKTGKALMGVSALGNLYSAKEGDANPMAILGLLMSSPRMAVYAFKGLDGIAARAPAIKRLGPALPRLQSTAIESNREDR